MQTPEQIEKVLLGAGCFWGVEEIFRKQPGILSTFVGYSGGQSPSPTYQQVCQGITGHAEVVEVIYSIEKQSFESILDIFFRLHDPTTLNRQGPDIGSQYRSAIYTYSEKHLKEAKEFIKKLEKEEKFSNPIITEVLPAKDFWIAEEYHQRYFQKNPGHGCHFLRQW